MTQSTRWCFTSHAEKLEIKSDFCKYYIYQKEKGEEKKRDHYQGFLILKRSQRLKKVKEIIGDEKVHVEKCKGTDAQNIEYCSKSETRIGDPIEFGEKPKMECGKRTDLKDFVEYIKNYKEKKINMIDLLTLYPNIVAKYRKFVDETIKVCKKRLIVEEETRNEQTKLHIISGPTGTGKTTKVKEFKDAYWKNEKTKWWDGYNGQEIVIINEYTGLGDINNIELLRLSDHAPYTLEIKGGTIQFTSKDIWITTNLTKSQFYCGLNTEHKNALKRRIEWIDMASG